MAMVKSFSPLDISFIRPAPQKKKINQSHKPIKAQHEFVSSKAAKVIGDIGEILAISYFNAILPPSINIINKTNDYGFGSDIIVGKKRYEIKTTTMQIQSKFIISRNELLQAKYNCDISNLFFIRLHKNKEEIVGWIINNFYSIFPNEIEPLLNSYQDDKIQFESPYIRVLIKDKFLASLSKIPMSHYIPSNWNWTSKWNEIEQCLMSKDEYNPEE